MSISNHSIIDEYQGLWNDGSSPDLLRFINLRSPIAVSSLGQILLIDQARRWEIGQRKSAVQYFAQFPGILESPEHAIDLLFSEFVLREKVDPTLSVEKLTEGYPQFADELQKQIDFHRTIESSLTDDSWQDRETQDSNTNDSEAGASGIDTLQGHSVQGYEILRELGRGGLGVVYLARDVRLHRKVALKMLLAGKFASESVLRRLVMEGEATARLQHPNIVQIYEVGEHEGHPYLALEYINGGTLSQRLEKGPQSPRDAALLMEAIARTVHYAHENGVVHRDLKPSNILIQDFSKGSGSDSENLARQKQAEISPGIRIFHRDVQVKVADFGLAKFVEEGVDSKRSSGTQTGDVLGTAAYMSPEQAKGKSAELTEATDIYSLGAILYELLTGRPPFVGVHPLEVMSQVVGNEPIPPSHLVRHIPKDLQTICLKCLEKNPSRRYATAAALADDLGCFLSDRPIVARHTMWLERSWRWCRRNPVKVAIASLGTLILLLVASLSILYNAMLSDQLTLITEAKNNEKNLRLNATHQLWEANLARADALQSSRQIGQRFESLKAVDAARDLMGSIDLHESQVDRMRNAVVAALALPDMELHKRWQLAWPTDYEHFILNVTSNIFAFQQKNGDVVIRRFNDGSDICHIPVNDRVRTIILSPDGSKVIIVTKVCSIYDIAEPKAPESAPERLFESTSGGPWAFSSDDSSQWFGHEKGGILKRFSEKGKQTHTIGTFPKAKQITISPDKRKVAIWVDDSIQVVDIESGAKLARFAPPAPAKITGQNSFVWHPNSRVLAIGPCPEGIITWDVLTGDKLSTIPKTNPSVSLLFDRDGDRLLTYDAWNSELVLWNTYSSEQEFQLKGLRLCSIVQNANQGFLVHSTDDQEWVNEHEIVLPSVYRTLPLVRSALAWLSSVDIAYSQDGELIAVAIRGVVDIVDSRSLRSLGQVFTGGCFPKFQPDGSLLTCNELGLFRWSTSKQKVDEPFNQVEQISFGPPQLISKVFPIGPIDFDQASGTFAVADGDGALIWLKEKQAPLRTQESHVDVRRVSIDGIGRRLATAGWNGGNVCVWELDTGKLIKSIPRLNPCLVQFSPNGRWMVVSEKELTVFETKNWNEIYQVNVPGESGSGVRPCFSPDSKSLACSDSNGNIHLLHADTGAEFALLRDPSQKAIQTMLFSPDGMQLATCTGEGIVHLWNLDLLQQELKSRELAWNLPASKFGSQSETESQLANKTNKEVRFVVDQSFRELETVEQIRRANWAIKNSDYSQAQLSITRALSLEPSDPMSCNNLAWVLATGPIQIRNPQQAVELARRAVVGSVDNKLARAVYSNTLGVSLYRAGEFEQAIETLKESLANGSPENHPFDYYFLSMSKARLGDKEGAQEDFDRAEELVKKLKSAIVFDQQRELEEFSKEAQSWGVVAKP